MSRWIVLIGILTASLSYAAGTRVAVHPLDARELTVEQREWLKAFFDVRLARIKGISLAGSNRIDDALRTAKGKDCEVKDSCLQYLAESSGALYGVYARLRREPLGGELLMTARVVRADGTVVKNLSRRAHPQANVELLETCRGLVTAVVDGLELQSLPTEPPQLAPRAPAPLPPPPLLTVETPARPFLGMSARRTAGFAIASVGLATLASGTVLIGMATDGRSRLTPDSTGAVPASQVGRAASVALQGRAATVLIPVGAVIGLGGALIALWPEDRYSVALNASSTGGGFLVGGALP